jgi:hypothetical protein
MIANAMCWPWEWWSDQPLPSRSVLARKILPLFFGLNRAWTIVVAETAGLVTLLMKPIG